MMMRMRCCQFILGAPQASKSLFEGEEEAIHSILAYLALQSQSIQIERTR